MSRHRDIRNLNIEESKVSLQDLLSSGAALSKVGLTNPSSKGSISFVSPAETHSTNLSKRPTLASLAKGLESVALTPKPSGPFKASLPLAEASYKTRLHDLAALISKHPSKGRLDSTTMPKGSKRLNLPVPTEVQLRGKLPQSSSSHPLLATPSPFALALCSPIKYCSFPFHVFTASDSLTLSSLVLEAASGTVQPSRFDTPSPDDIVLQAQSGAGPKQTSKVCEAISLEGLTLEAKPKVEAKPPASRRIDVLAECRLRSTKPTNLNLIVVGHVDAGKSTLMGHFLYQAGVVDRRTLQKYQRDAEKIGKKSFAFAWVLDETLDERERGITVDVARTQFKTARHHVTVLDAPGHRDFISNMISGATQADVAILVVDSTPGEFESGFARGGQTKEHALLIRSLGVRQVAVAINKLDVCGWDRGRFDSIKAELGDFLASVGFSGDRIAYVPVSGLKGENLFGGVSSDHPLKLWYDGPSLLQAIDAFDPLVRPVEAALRFPVADFFRGGIDSSSGVSVSGRILQGHLQVGDTLAVLPGDAKGVVKSIEANHEASQWAVAGDSVVMTMGGLDILELRSGSVLCQPQAPVPVSNSFLAQVLVFEPSMPITNGYPVILHHQTVNAAAYITSLICLLDKFTGDVLKRNPRHLPKNCAATVKITVEAPLCLEAFSSCKDLGRFALRRAGVTVATGVVLEVLPSL